MNLLPVQPSCFDQIVFLRFAALVILLIGPCKTTLLADETAELEFFENRIRPVLIEHCYECHSAESKVLKAGLLVDSAEGLRVGGDSGSALLPGDSSGSLLMQALRYESTEMPPQGKLPDQVIADFARWIDSGAIDPRTNSSSFQKPKIDIEEFRNFWSFVPPAKPEEPEIKRTDWPAHVIDYFVLAKMEEKSLEPVKPASKRALIRRATFDLIGLPPTPEEVAAFINDSSPNAFETVVERLLQSTAYGERWGRYWLDVARYAEDQAHTFSVTPNTNGFRYRDWVISAFNSDMPYDLFLKRQIAADLMDEPEEDRLQHLPALGYFGLGAQYYKNTDAAKAAADELDDRIDTLTRGFLGLTVSCARCHDHKFDPIPQQDYYSLAGIFQSSRLHNAPLVPKPEVEAYQRSQKQIKDLEEAISQTIATQGPRVREARVEQIASYMMTAWKQSRARALKLKLPSEKMAEDSGLDAKTLKRWSEFLRKEESKKISVLAKWYEAIQTDSEQQTSSSPADTLEIPDTIRDAAQQVQRIAALLLRQRDGQLSEAEANELAKSVDTGNAIYRSRLVTKSEPVVTIDVDITDSKELFLVVTDGGNGNSCDHADWAEPVLLTKDGNELSLTDLKWRETKTTYGTVNVDRNVNGQGIRIGGKQYRFGLGTHATSMIAYELPEGVTRFRAIGGLDNSGSDQGGCGANASVQFHVYTQSPRDVQINQADVLDLLFGEKGVFAVESDELEKHLPPEQAEALAEQRDSLKQLKESAPAMYPIAHVIAEAEPANMKVFIRGNPANQGDVAPRRFLRILCNEEPAHFQKGSGRLELADSIASADNPLTARVMVNRIWQHHFGRGLVGTPDNFGVLGEKPTHPELLDYLTHLFLESGWSIKSMHREIMLSSTYQLSTDRNDSNSNIDADNQFLWRMNRRRLQIEAWRDALLAVSGRLDPQLGGPSTNLADAGNNRRTIYAFISRHELNNMLRLFDFPDANITASTRTETTVPQQQLFVLNSPFMIEQARAFAKRLLDEVGEDIEARIHYAFELAYGRSATQREVLLAKQFLSGEDQEEERSLNSLNRWERYAQVILGSNEFMYLD
ncbi:DUF1553 domain-containing protein [Pirellulaceae bacterium SH449]